MAGPTVLYVEDLEPDRMLLQAACRMAGVSFELVCLDDGDTLIKYLSGEGLFADRQRHPPPALVLLDLKMPLVDGFGALAWIRQHPDLGHIPVIVLTSSSAAQDIRRAYTLGAVCFLSKAGSLDRLVELVKNIDYCLRETPGRFEALHKLPEYRKPEPG